MMVSCRLYVNGNPQGNNCSKNRLGIGNKIRISFCVNLFTEVETGNCPYGGSYFLLNYMFRQEFLKY